MMATLYGTWLIAVLILLELTVQYLLVNLPQLVDFQERGDTNDSEGL
jgi:hypothetical protein